MSFEGTGSFSQQDLGILQSVLDSSLASNIEKIDLILGNLQKIKRALLQAESTREVIIPPEGQTLTLQAGNC